MPPDTYTLPACTSARKCETHHFSVAADCASVNAENVRHFIGRHALIGGVKFEHLRAAGGNRGAADGERGEGAGVGLHSLPLSRRTCARKYRR